MTVLEYMKDHLLFLDGGMGSLLQNKGIKPGEHPERWSISHPDVIEQIHLDYFNAGCNVVNTNSFGANTLKFDAKECDQIIKASIENAKRAAARSTNPEPKFVALDIGPCGKLLKPYGDLEFEDAVECFAGMVRSGVKYGADLIFIETMNDSYETKAALLAAKENSDLPVFVSNAYGEDGKLMTGATPAAMVAMIEGMGADAIGCNCSLGPAQLRGVVDELLANASIPVMLKPNAGLPKDVNGKAVYDVLPDEFADEVVSQIKAGVNVAGGCCGTTPEYIKALTTKAAGLEPTPVTKKNKTVVSSYTHAVEFAESPILIGERINPTGKKRFKQALIENDIDYILQEGVNQQDAGVQILDVNVGLPDIDEVSMLSNVMYELQAIINLPLQIDTADAVAMEKALRRYNGKAMINSVNGKEESMKAIFPLVKKYGGVVVALTLDENGIPATAEGRIEIAKKILETAATYGIDKKDIIFDTLAMTISADPAAALATLKSLEYIKNEMGCHTSLGVSNISFGLPKREGVNSTFFAMALERGLSAAIMNPYATDMLKVYYAYRALHNLDENCADYIEFATNLVETAAAPAQTAAAKTPEDFKSQLQKAIVKGLKDQAAEVTGQLLSTTDALEIIQQEIIPALDIVGKGFEEKTVYLPQLLMSAEAAKASFEVIKANMPSGKSIDKFPMVIATVHGDIHDIGKNIVKLLLENYGFKVIDLGKDVPPADIVAAVIENHAPVCGLSALMTTTVPAMEETIKLLAAQAPWCKVVVGGAVLNEDYANRIGAGKYAKDAMDTVRFADSVEI